MTVDELKTQGNAALKAGKYDEAIKCYTDAIAIEPENHILYSNRSNIYYQAANYNDALADAEQCIKLNPGFAKGFIRKIDALNALGRVFDAQSAIDEAAAAHPTDPTISERKKQLDASQNIFGDRLGRSAAELQARINAYPELAKEVKQDPTLFARMDAVRQNPTNLDAFMADQQLQRALFTLMGMGDMMGGHGGPGAAPSGPGAQPTPQRATPPPPPPPPQPKMSPEEEAGNKLKEEGNKLFASKDYEGAVQKYEAAFEVHKSITYLNNASTALLKKGDAEAALAKAEEALQWAQEHGGASLQEKAKALAKAGSALYHMGRLKEAQAKLKDSMFECRDKQTLQLLNKVEDELDRQRVSEAFDPEGAAALKDRGNALVKEQKFMEAADAFSEALKKLPQSLDTDDTKKLKSQLFNNRAIALFKGGQIHASYEDSQHVLELDPDNIKAIMRKGQIERIRKQYYLSVKSYQRAMQLDPQSSEARDGYMKTYQKISQMQNGQLSAQEMEEIRNIALQDEEVASIAKDPGIAQAIQQLQQNPQAAQQLMSNPAFKDKLETLINAGILQIGHH